MVDQQTNHKKMTTVLRKIARKKKKMEWTGLQTWKEELSHQLLAMEGIDWLKKEYIYFW